LVEQGTHAELIARGGLYASLWSRQRQAEKAREELAAALEAGSGASPDPASPQRPEVAAMATARIDEPPAY
jgi:ATP-binding cassette subfamily B protein